jgi:hypothetical protein
LPAELFIGILSTRQDRNSIGIATRSGAARRFQAQLHHQTSRFRTNSFHVFEQHRSVRAQVSSECHYRLYQGSEMKNPTFISELHKKLGAPTSEIVDSLRLLKAFVKLAPPQRYEVIEVAERLANDDSPSSEHPLS